MRKITTERLVLEPIREAHAADMFRILGDPIMYTFLHERPPFTEEELRARYRFLERRVAPDGEADWLTWIVREEGGEPLGVVQAERYPAGPAGLSVMLAPPAWGDGFAREALAAVVGELSRKHDVQGFFALISPRNEPALRLFERLGFRQQARAAFDLRAVDNGDLVYVLGRGEANGRA